MWDQININPSTIAGDANVNVWSSCGLSHLRPLPRNRDEKLSSADRQSDSESLIGL
jgi:hypothetical protein